MYGRLGHGPISGVAGSSLRGARQQPEGSVNHVDVDIFHFFPI